MKRFSTKGTNMDQEHEGEVQGLALDLRVLSFPFVSFVDGLSASGPAR